MLKHQDQKSNLKEFRVEDVRDDLSLTNFQDRIDMARAPNSSHLDPDSDEESDNQERKWDRQQRSIMHQWDIADIFTVIPEYMRPATYTDLIDYPGAYRGTMLQDLYELAKFTRRQYKHVITAFEESLRSRGGRTLSRDDIRSAFSKLVWGDKHHNELRAPVPISAISQTKAHSSASRPRQQPPPQTRPSARRRSIARQPRRPAHTTIRRNPALLPSTKADSEASLKLLDAIHALRTAETAYNLARDDRAIAYLKQDQPGINLLVQDRNVTAAEQEVNFAHASVDSRRRLWKAGCKEEEEERGEEGEEDGDGDGAI